MENSISPKEILEVLKVLEKDEMYMRQCLELAQGMAGFTSPRPMVGCVIVKNGKVIGQGVTQKNGAPHGEASAINNATESIQGSTVYMNLEPCFHNSQGMACSHAFVQKGVKEVVIGTLDVAEKNRGKGKEFLEKNNITTRVGVLEDECKWLNRIFFHWTKNKTPYIMASVGVSRDFKIAASPGIATKITGEEGMKRVHQLRHQFDAILVGVGTVISDNPALTDRMSEQRNDPLRLILDAKLRSSHDAKVFADNNVFVATTKLASKSRLKDFEGAGIQVVVFPHAEDEEVKLDALLKYAAQRDITSIMVEGGQKVYDSFINENLIQEWQIFQNKFIIGTKGLDVSKDLERFKSYIDNGKKENLGEDTLSIFLAKN